MARAANILAREHGAHLANSGGGGFLGAARAWQSDDDATTSPNLFSRFGDSGVGASGGGGGRKLVRGLVFPTEDR